MATFQWGWGLGLVGLSVAVLVASAMVRSLAPAPEPALDLQPWVAAAGPAQPDGDRADVRRDHVPDD